MPRHSQTGPQDLISQGAGLWTSIGYTDVIQRPAFMSVRQLTTPLSPTNLVAQYASRSIASASASFIVRGLFPAMRP